MTTTLDQPAGKAVEAMPDAPADMEKAVERLMGICGHRECHINISQSVFPDSTWPTTWLAGARYGRIFLCGRSDISADDAVDEWVKVAREHSSAPVAPLPELPVESVLAREPYDARSPQAEERERVECDPFDPM